MIWNAIRLPIETTTPIADPLETKVPLNKMFVLLWISFAPLRIGAASLLTGFTSPVKID